MLQIFRMLARRRRSFHSRYGQCSHPPFTSECHELYMIFKMIFTLNDMHAKKNIRTFSIEWRGHTHIQSELIVHLGIRKDVYRHRLSDFIACQCGILLYRHYMRHFVSKTTHTCPINKRFRLCRRICMCMCVYVSDHF